MVCEVKALAPIKYSGQAQTLYRGSYATSGDLVAAYPNNASRIEGEWAFVDKSIYRVMSFLGTLTWQYTDSFFIIDGDANVVTFEDAHAVSGGPVTIPSATPAAAGVMTAADKSKLDSLVANYKGVYNTKALLDAAHATGTDGDWAIVRDPTGPAQHFSWDSNSNSWEAVDFASITGHTNLSYIASPSFGTLTSDTGADAVIPAATVSSAGLLLPSEKETIATISNSVVDKGIFNARLSLSPSLAYSDTDITAANFLYLQPYNGSSVGLFDGNTWVITDISTVSKPLSATMANTNYDVFVSLSNGAPVLTLSPWSNDTTRANGEGIIVFSGIDVLESDNKKRFCGTIRTVGGGSCEDSSKRRFVSNRYNRIERSMQSTVSGTHTYTVSTWRAWRNNTTVGQGRLEFVECGVQEPFVLLGNVQSFNTSSTQSGFVSIGVNSLSGSAFLTYWRGLNQNTIFYGLGANGIRSPRSGFNFVNLVQLGQSPSINYLLGQINIKMRT